MAQEHKLGMAIAAALGEGVMMETTVADRTFQINPMDLPDNALLDLLRYGTQRRFNDATGGSDKTPDEKHAKVAEMIGNYKEGVIRAQRGGGGTDELTKIMRQEMQKLVKAKLDATVYKQEFTDAEASVRNAKLDKLIEANRKAIEPIAQAELKRREDERKSRAKLAGGLNIEL
jgi:hypothetical protein